MVYLFLAEGFEDIEAVAPLDILDRAGIPVTKVGVGGLQIKSAHGFTVICDCMADGVILDDAKMLILPGGPGVDNLAKSEKVRCLISAGFDKYVKIAAICAAPVLLARWGLLDGYKAACFPGMEDRLTGCGACVEFNKKVVCDRNIITSQAAGSAIEFALKLAEELTDTATAERVRSSIHYDG